MESKEVMALIKVSLVKLMGVFLIKEIAITLGSFWLERIGE